MALTINNQPTDETYTLTTRGGQKYNIRPSALGAKKLKITAPDGTIIENPSPELLQQIQEYIQQINYNKPYIDVHRQAEYPNIEQGEIKPAEDVSAPVNAVNQYFRELNYRLANNKVLPGKYTLPAIGLVATGIGAALSAPATTAATMAGGWAGNKAVDLGMNLATGKSWTENMQDWTGFDKEPAEITNPGMWIGGGLPMVNKSSKTLLSTADNSIVSHPKWYRNAFLDVTTKPLKTFKAIKNGQYVYDIPSLMRNVRSAQREIQTGIQSTNNEYKALTGLDIDEPSIHINSWKHFKPGTTGYYLVGRIHMPLTRNRLSNIRNSTNSLRRTGGHEQAHYANDVLTSTFNTPQLGKYSLKTKYFVPNPDHNIALKYQNQFMKRNQLQKNFLSKQGLNHGKYPEETWANYMGAKAAGWNDLHFKLDNLSREGILPPKGFISDYKQYLTDTYSSF